MKKSIKVISIILSVAVVLTLSLTLVACNKDTIETTTVTEGVENIVLEIGANSAAADNFRIIHESKDSHNCIGFDYVVMKVSYGTSVAMAYGTESYDDFDNNTSVKREILLGDYYTLDEKGNKYFSHKDIAYYEKTINGWELAQEYSAFSSGYTKVSDLEVYVVTDYIYNYFNSEYPEATLLLQKTTKNGDLDSYSVTLTIDAENVVTFKTVDYNGKQCVSELTYTMSKDKEDNDPTISKYTYTYGATFEIPVVEE